MELPSDFWQSDIEQQPSPAGIGDARPVRATGMDKGTGVPEGITTSSALEAFGEGGEDGVGTGVVVGTVLAGGEVAMPCWDAIASCKRHFTSSAVARSAGDWPSWFLRNGSAP